MASAPVVIPQAQTILADGVTLDATLTTAQTVFTVPNGMKCVISAVVFRDATASVNAATTFSVGVNGTANNVVSASTAAQSMAAGNAVRGVATLTSTSTAYGTSGQNCTLTFAGTLTSNGFVKCDVLGYLVAF